MKRFIEFNNEVQYDDDKFIDYQEDFEMEEEEAKELFSNMSARYLELSGSNIEFTPEFVKEFKMKIGLSIRKIAAIMNLNKDKVNKLLKQ